MKALWHYGKYVILGLLSGALLIGGWRFFEANFTLPLPAGNGSAQADAYAAPEHIAIPAIGVSAKVIPVGVAADGSMDVAHNQFDVAWYDLGPRPGADGTAVLAGHLDTKLTPTAVFYNLNKLQPGDEVIITDASGRTLNFRVSESQTIPYNAATGDIFTNQGPSRIALVTCAGYWIKAKKSYSERLIVFADKT